MRPPYGGRFLFGGSGAGMFKRIIAVLMILPCWAYAGADEIVKGMERAKLNAKVEGIIETPMQGLFQVNLEGGRVLYASEDGRFFIQGYLYEAKEGGTINLTDAEERKGVLAALGHIKPADMIVFPAVNERSSIVVFTDTECPFCHKLHEDVGALNEAGITVRYLAYPRHGMDSSGGKALERVWCSQDRRKAISDAIDGEEVDSNECSNPVESQFELGRQIGVQGTPTIILSNGQLLVGYQGKDSVIQAVLSVLRSK